jgi:TonB family protein
MVRAIDSCIWHNAPFLERVRPGLAISVLLHAALLIALAYYLAFHSPMAPPTEDPVEPITVRELPRPQPPPLQSVENTLHVKRIDVIEGIHTKIPPINLRPFEEPPTGSQKTAPTETPPGPTISDARPIKRGNVFYPERALDAGRAGYVDFTFTIEPDGSVGDLKMIQEVPIGFGFATAAEKAMPTWRFEPKLVDGKPVPTLAHYRFSFQLK